MKNFFLQLLKANGVILLLLSVGILLQLWTEIFNNDAMFRKIIFSYVIIVVNFIVLSTVYRHVESLENETIEAKK